MFFFGRFNCSVYLKLLRHWLEVKGPRMERMMCRGGERERQRETETEKGRHDTFLFLCPVVQRAAGVNEEGAGSHVLLLVQPQLLLRVKV